jgi:hypothetical protein
MRTGLSARQSFLRGQVSDSHYLDMLFFVRYAQKLISLEVNDESARVVTKFKKQTKVDQFVDNTFDRMFGTNVDEERMKKASIAELRVEVLEDNLRPALINNEVWSDVMKWRFNFRVIKWARQEFLISKYGPEVKVRQAWKRMYFSKSAVFSDTYVCGLLKLIGGPGCVSSTSGISTIGSKSDQKNADEFDEG